MGFDDYTESMGGVAIEEFPVDGRPALNCKGCRIAIDWDAYEKKVKFTDVFAKVLACDDVGQLEALAIGAWDGAMEGEGNDAVVEALVAARDQLPALRCLFIGDILQEESEASWIQQNDVSAVFLAFPQLEELRVRGTNGLSLGRPEHERLQRLVIEGGGLPADVSREVDNAQLPALTHLELWLGDENYGRSTDKDDLARVLSGAAFPQLKYLGLRNDAEADRMVEWLDGAAVLDQIDVLDLSGGCLGDDGVEKLIKNEGLRSLKKLDLHHHYSFLEATDRLEQALPGVEIDVGDRMEEERYDDEVYRYNLVSE